MEEGNSDRCQQVGPPIMRKTRHSLRLTSLSLVTRAGAGAGHGGQGGQRGHRALAALG